MDTAPSFQTQESPEVITADEIFRDKVKVVAFFEAHPQHYSQLKNLPVGKNAWLTSSNYYDPIKATEADIVSVLLDPSVMNTGKAENIAIFFNNNPIIKKAFFDFVPLGIQ